MDLTQYLLLHEPELQQQLAPPKSDAVPFAGVNVLELGCGHGLPGLFMLSRGAAVDFQVRDRWMVVEEQLLDCNVED